MLAGCEANFEPDAGRPTNQERALKYNNFQWQLQNRLLKKKKYILFV